MTAYVTTTTIGPVSPPITVTTSIKSISWPTRIAKIELFCNGGGTVTITGYRGATQSGGSTVTPFPLRTDSTAATASVKSSATTSGSSSLVMSYQQVGAGSTSYEFPFDCVLAVGDGMSVSYTNPTSGSIMYVSIYFEEIREDWAH